MTSQAATLPPIPAAYDWDNLRTYGKDAIDYVADYHGALARRELPVTTPALKPGFLVNAMPKFAPEQGSEWSTVMDTIHKHVTPGMAHWQHPDFYAFFPSMVSPPALVADMLASSYGTPGFTWAAGPSATEMEVVVMNWLAAAFGLPADVYTWQGTGGGVLQPTATEAAIVAMVAAREKATKSHSLRGSSTSTSATRGGAAAYVVYYSDQAHFCVEKAARVLGIAHRRVVRSVYDADNDNHSMDAVELERLIKEDLAAGLCPIFVSANYGATGTCATDDLPVIARICRAHQLWFNVDGAYAGVTAMCPELRPAMQGIEEADSILINGSKWFSLMFNNTFFFFRDKQYIAASLNASGIFLKNDASDKGTVVDLKDYHLGLGRPFRALKVFATITMFGLEGLRAVLRRHIILARDYLVPTLKLLAPALTVRKPKFGLVCFHAESDLVTQRLLDLLNQSGIYVVPTMSNHRLHVRCSLAHPRLGVADMTRLAGLVALKLRDAHSVGGMAKL